MNDDKLTEEELDALFHAAQQDPGAPPAEWLARVVADAERELSEPSAFIAPPSLWMQLVSALGGRPGLGGMALAGAAGLWIGFAPPALLGDPVGTTLGAESPVDLLSDDAFAFATLLDEG